MYQNFDNFTEDDFAKTMKVVNDGYRSDPALGRVELGMLCIDLIADTTFARHGAVQFDVYVGGNDTGYAVTANDEPYDYAAGGALITEGNADKFASYEDFKTELLRVIHEYSLTSGYRDASGHSLDELAHSDSHFNW